ncbi:MAG TPA: molybdopterin-guanine dinucleotide biosynthesis protein B [Acidiphilium sp.]|nr:MAG: molybdopterin-guanine dinucleotide biosynthesis protein B [Acidiphilium sp. 21-60-14]OYV89526.1 MAG: molybdopterin-guanine dinucleotide biosynthesis protein B [Acidiphilium sp. 37-60-79]OZB39669.1 MAG: molybdopterin-guanine dinucleotide biosynthesis protein B [Acidiphilium sp. 34-60-192]HQT87478.1 molybdopterin-guanine dinucleotide biosynthesis protein B [Acidiphilium sp.]HQU24852.1 molybdopterin-guanine dinucleotide biosynthesis protein B [Acidiphilium sp.]
MTPSPERHPARILPNVLALVGWSGSGKTTLLTALLPILSQWGMTISTLKHAHHAVDPDQPGKDSHRHRQAGAQETMLATAARFVLFAEHRGGSEPDLGALLARMAPADLYMAEGFKSAPVAKIEIHRPALGKPPLWPDLPDIIAVASDQPLPGCPKTRLDLGDPAAIARFIADHLSWQIPPLEIKRQTGR